VSSALPRLSRGLTGVARAEPRIVHLGLGGFHRAHQAWWTDAVDHEGAWGITAFSGRSAGIAAHLSEQDGLFTLLERSDSGDSATVVSSIVDAVDGSDVTRLCAAVAAEATALVTLTITEAGYRTNAQGRLDFTQPEVADDLERLRTFLKGNAEAATLPTTTPARLFAALEARRRASGAPIALVSCDNLPRNAGVLRGVLEDLADRVAPDARGWLADSVSFVSTSVDRITPHTVDADRATVEALCGWSDRVPVVTEPFRDWVLSGEFPLGRPAWENEGARFVDDIEPWEMRKLLLLNGAHSIFATAGRLRGHSWVSDAVADDVCLAWAHDFWDEASRYLPEQGLDLEAYRSALLARFANTRIAHSLAQIAMETSSKLRVRFVPVALGELAVGRDAHASAVPLAAWVAGVLVGLPIDDSRGAEIAAAVSGSASVADASRRLIAILSEELAAQDSFVSLVAELATALRGPASRP
jgi:fructuronate reductase